MEDRLDKAARRRVLRRCFEDLKPWRTMILVSMVVVVVATLTRLAGPQLIAWGIDGGIAKGADGLPVLYVASALWVVAALAGYFLGRQQVWLVSLVGESFLRDLRARVFRHILRLDLDFFDRERSGRLVSRMTSDVESLQHFVSQGLIVLVSSVLTFVLTVAILFVMSWQLTLVTLSILPPLIVASVIFRRRANPAYLTVRERIASVLTRLQENLSGIRVVQAYNREGVDTDAFTGVNEGHYRAVMRTAKISSIYFPVVEFIGLAGTVLVLAYGGWLSARGVIGFGVVAAFMFYLGNLFDPIQQVSQLYNDLQAAAAALDKLYRLLDEEPKVVEAPDAIRLRPNRGELRLQDVSFSYVEGRPAVKGVSLTIPPGTRVALVGETGAGKSTLVKLITRFYDPDEGRIEIDGFDIAKTTFRSLRSTLGFVPQEGFVFSGSIWENIALGRDGASRGDVIAACRAMGILEIFERLPEGLDTQVEERGGRLSAGQRQLIALCRAFLADPRILILDEATSALDPATTRAVEEAIPRLLEGRTSITIAHRLSTAARADMVVLVDGGEILETGSHEELIRARGAYARLYATWER